MDKQDERNWLVLGMRGRGKEWLSGDKKPGAEGDSKCACDILVCLSGET